MIISILIIDYERLIVDQHKNSPTQSLLINHYSRITLIILFYFYAFKYLYQIKTLWSWIKKNEIYLFFLYNNSQKLFTVLLQIHRYNLSTLALNMSLSAKINNLLKKWHTRCKSVLVWLKLHGGWKNATSLA